MYRNINNKYVIDAKLSNHCKMTMQIEAAQISWNYECNIEFSLLKYDIIFEWHSSKVSKF